MAKDLVWSKEAVLGADESALNGRMVRSKWTRRLRTFLVVVAPGRLISKRVITTLVIPVLASLLLSGMPALAQAPADPQVLPEKPQEGTKPKESKEEAPTTCGPIICDSCIPIETGQASLQVLWAMSVYTANFSQNWRPVSTKGDLFTFNMPAKFTYGPAKNLETYIIAPFIVNWVNNVDRSVAGPNGERSASYAGIGDITTVAKYQVLEEGEIRPAVSLVGGVTWPSGHASHLNPRFLPLAGPADSVGTGAFTFTTGVNLFKWVKPFLLYSNIWLDSPINIYKLTADNAKDPPVRALESVTFNLAAEYPLTERWTLLLEMYSTWTWDTISTSVGFQTPTTILGFLPGIECRVTDKWSFSAGCAFDTIGKFPTSRTIVPMLTACYSF